MIVLLWLLCLYYGNPYTWKDGLYIETMSNPQLFLSSQDPMESEWHHIRIKTPQITGISTVC